MWFSIGGFSTGRSLRQLLYLLWRAQGTTLICLRSAAMARCRVHGWGQKALLDVTEQLASSNYSSPKVALGKTTLGFFSEHVFYNLIKTSSNPKPQLSSIIKIYRTPATCVGHQSDLYCSVNPWYISRAKYGIKKRRAKAHFVLLWYI